MTACLKKNFYKKKLKLTKKIKKNKNFGKQKLRKKIWEKQIKYFW